MLAWSVGSVSYATVAPKGVSGNSVLNIIDYNLGALCVKRPDRDEDRTHTENRTLV